MTLPRTVAVVAVLAASVAWAQGQKPNFSGTWLLVAPAERAARAPAQEETITQTDTTITLGHPSEGGGHRMTYRLDGQETENRLAGMRFVSRASWDGQKLMLIDKDAAGAALRPGARETKKILHIDQDGSLVMEVTGSTADRPGEPTRSVWRKR